jgi:hypothetical protein
MSNLAKDWQTGTYVISVYNNRVKVSRPKQGNGKPFVEAEARCAPEDEFSLSMGMALAMARLNEELSKNKIEVGDKVKIKKCGLSYTTYSRWIKKNIDDVGLAACYVFGQTPKLDETEYIVKAIAPWCVAQDKDKGEMLAYIQRYYKFNSGRTDDNQPCYLICINELEKV